MNQARFARKNETYWVVFIYIHVVWGNGILKLGLLIHDFFLFAWNTILKMLGIWKGRRIILLTFYIFRIIRNTCGLFGLNFNLDDTNVFANSIDIEGWTKTDVQRCDKYNFTMNHQHFGKKTGGKMLEMFSFLRAKRPMIICHVIAHAC